MKTSEYLICHGAGCAGAVKHYTEFNVWARDGRTGRLGLDGVSRRRECKPCDRARARTVATIRRMIEQGEGLTRALYSQISKEEQQRLRKKYNALFLSDHPTPANDNTPEMLLKPSPFLEQVRRDNPQVVDDASSQTTDPRGQVYVLYYAHDPHWLCTGKGIRDDRIRSYNTYTPYRDTRVLLRITTTDRASAETWLQDLFAKHADEIGVRPKNKTRSEWFKFNQPRRAVYLTRMFCLECPGIAEFLPEVLTYDEEAA